MCDGGDVDDDSCHKGHGQPAVGLPNPLVPVQCDLFLETTPLQIGIPTQAKTGLEWATRPLSG
jgi:hypothetical protein